MRLCVCWGEEGGAMRLKSRNLKKVRVGSLLSVLSKFQLPSSIWRGDGGGTNSRHKINHLRNHIFGAIRDHDETKKSNLPKGTSTAPTTYTYLISTSQFNLKGNREGTALYLGQKREKPSYLPF